MKGKKNILILGSTGMLGSDIKVFVESKKYNIAASVTSKNLKFLKFEKFKKINFFKFNILQDSVIIKKVYKKGYNNY